MVSLPMPQAHMSGNAFWGIFQVRAWSCIVKVNRNFSVLFFLRRCNFIGFNALISDLQQCVMNEVLGSWHPDFSPAEGLSCIFHAYTARCDPTAHFKKKKK